MPYRLHDGRDRSQQSISDHQGLKRLGEQEGGTTRLNHRPAASLDAYRPCETTRDYERPDHGGFFVPSTIRRHENFSFMGERTSFVAAYSEHHIRWRTMDG
jgi:hypothetical protein